MRITALILASLLLVLTAGLGFLGANRCFKDAKELTQAHEKLQTTLSKLPKKAKTALMAQPEVKKALAYGKKAGRLRVGGVLFILGGLLAVGLLVLMFLDRWVPYLSGAVFLVAAVSIFVIPSYETGRFGPAPARQLAYVLTGLAAVGALCAVGASYFKRRKQEKSQSYQVGFAQS